jgi:ABC-type lipoprotein release transport system permease subunit
MKAGLFEFALCSMAGRRSKFIFVFIILTLLLFVCFSVFFVTASLRAESSYGFSTVPDITVKTNKGGRNELISTSKVDDILMIPGVEYANPAYFGLYSFEYLKANLTVVGIDPFAEQYAGDFDNAVRTNKDIMKHEQWMIVGGKLAETLKAIYNKESFSFALADGNYLELPVVGTFAPQSQIMSSSTIITDIESARQILSIPNGKAVQISVYVSNQDETDTIAQKIAVMFPDTAVTTKEFSSAAVSNMFDFSSGIFLLVFSLCLFTFFIIVFDRASGLNMEERRETAVLKAVGYTPSDIIKVKFYETLITTVSAFVTALVLAMLYVYAFQAPLLKPIFTGYSYLRPEFILPFVLPAKEIILTFMTIIPVYAAAAVIPAWRASVTDAQESLR